MSAVASAEAELPYTLSPQIDRAIVSLTNEDGRAAVVGGGELPPFNHPDATRAAEYPLKAARHDARYGVVESVDPHSPAKHVGGTSERGRPERVTHHDGRIRGGSIVVALHRTAHLCTRAEHIE